MMNNSNLPLNIIMQNVKRKLEKTLSECIMEYGIPAYLTTGILSEILLETHKQERIELINSYDSILNEVKQTLTEIQKQNEN